MKVEWSRQYQFLAPPPGSRPAWPWALEELRQELLNWKADVNIHALGLPDGDEGLCIHEEDGLWLVYYSERGMRSGAAVFTSPFDAANYYLWSIVCGYKTENLSTVGRLPKST
jgi:hypothetical protein